MPDDLKGGSVTPAVGRTLGRYRLDALLGRGGMAEVFRATDTKLARTVAVKVILGAHGVEDHFLERFLREARMVASLEHPNILPVYDFGEENGMPFLVMPYLPGGSLRDRLKAGPVPLAVASSWIAQLSDALDAAHAAGVLHRDVKPANVLLGKDDRLFLADFGIAKMVENQTGLTATGVVVGTPIYMAPEQAQGHPATPATDRYALAVVAFEILAGRPPFEGDNPLSLMHQHVSTPPPMLSMRVAGLPAGLDTVLSQALSKDPLQRPATCRAFATGVAAFAPAGITAPYGLAGGSVSTGANTAPTLLQTPDPRPATAAPGTTPWTPPATAAPVRVSDARPSLTSAATVLTGPRRDSRRAAFVAAGAIVALAGAWWVVSRRREHELNPAAVSNATSAPSAASATSVTSPAASAAPAVPAPAPPPAVAVVEKSPVPAAAKAPVPTKAMPLVKPAPVPPPTPEAASELDDRAHPLAAAHQRLDVARTATHRLAQGDFLFVLEESERALRKHPLNPEAKYLELYARGGLAYVARTDQVAAKLLVEALNSLDGGPRRNAHPIENLLRRPDGSIGEPNAWQLAIAYGDARGEAMGLVERELSVNPRNLRALRARALLRKMQGADEEPTGDVPRPRILRRQRPG